VKALHMETGPIGKRLLLVGSDQEKGALTKTKKKKKKKETEKAVSSAKQISKLRNCREGRAVPRAAD